MDVEYKRIIIVGDSGRGKSTLAQRISSNTGIPWHSTDDFYYEAKFSKARTRSDALEKIKNEFEKDEWIIEGSTFWLLEQGPNSADLIICLRYRNIFAQWWRIFWRGLFRKHETFKGTFQLMKHVFYKRYGLGYKKGALTIEQFIEPYKNKVITLSSFREINKFIRKIK
jgi:adenylate kinase family enzyme